MLKAGAIKLGENLDGQAKPPPGWHELTVVRERTHQIAAKLKYGPDLALHHSLGGFGAIEALFPGRIESIELLEFVIGNEVRFLGDADRSLPLHIRVAAYRQDAGARLAHVAAQKQEIDDHLDIFDATDLLRDTHAVGDHRALCLCVDGASRLDGEARQPRAAFEFGPVSPTRGFFKSVEAVGVFADESEIENPRAACFPCCVIHLKKSLAEAHQRCLVSSDLELMILRTDLGGRLHQHLGWILRVGEALVAALAQRIKDDDRNAALGAFLQIMEHARTIDAGIVPEKQDAVGLVEVGERYRSHRNSDTERQTDGRALVAHVRTVRQIVVAVHAGEEGVHIGGFERGAA